jgi:hypothetical protein
MIPLPGLLLLGTTSVFGATIEVPPGTELKLRLTIAIPGHARAGVAVAAVLIAPVARDGQIVLPTGSVLDGVVEAAGELPRERHRSYLQVAFREIAIPAGEGRPIEGRVTDVDNARETVDANGRIVGLAWVGARPTRVETLLLLAAHAHPVALAAAEAAKLGVREIERVPIEYPPGTEMTLALIAPLRTAAPAPGPERPDLSADDELMRLASALPTRAEAAKFRRPSDPTNVLLVGPRDAVLQAFLDAGWTEARPLGLKTGMKSFLALARRHGYQPAPVSLLQLGGAPPDLVFEKQNNTLAKRHHVRIWPRPESFRGHRIWLGAATHDIGIAFDRGDRTFTHRIDGRIDGEREKLMADLEFTGRVRATGLVERPLVPRRTENATGDAVETDGRLGVLVLADVPPDPGP